MPQSYAVQAIPQLTSPPRTMTTVSPSHLAFVLGISARWIFELTRRGVLAKDPQTGDYALEANVEAFLTHARQREVERAAEAEAERSAVLFRASQVLVAEPQPEPQTRNRWQRK